MARGEASVRYPLVQDEASLPWLVDYGCVDLHVWTARHDRPDRPDHVLFDLDPWSVPFAAVVEALTTLGLDSFAPDVVADRARRHGDVHAGVLVGRELLRPALRRASG